MAKEVLRIELPEEIVAKYERQAKKQKVPLEELLSDRLKTAVSYTSSKPIYLSDDYRQTVEKLLKRNIDGPGNLIKALERLVDVKVGKTTIDIPPRVLERVKTRCFGKPFDQVLSEQVVLGLEQFVGLR